MSFDPPETGGSMPMSQLQPEVPPPTSPAGPALWSVSVEAPDAPGLLSKLLVALTELQLDIRSADVRTSGDSIVNRFVVAKREGVLAQELIDRIKAALA